MMLMRNAHPSGIFIFYRSVARYRVSRHVKFCLAESIASYITYCTVSLCEGCFLVSPAVPPADKKGGSNTHHKEVLVPFFGLDKTLARPDGAHCSILACRGAPSFCILGQQ